MQRNTLRHLALIALLIVGAGATLLLRSKAPESVPQEQSASPQFIFHVDTAGWYKTTSNESVVASPFDLTPSAVPESLPLTLQNWRGTELGTDKDIETWFDHPDVVVRRRYEDEGGHVVWLTLVASSGPKSFHIFEHTPHSCYPSACWTTLQDDIHRIVLNQGTIPVRRGAFEREGATNVVYYWYQWNSPARDPAKGVASWRLTTNAPDGREAAEARLAVFLNLLFRETLPWNRF